MINEVKTGCRITCMDVINDEGKASKSKKKHSKSKAGIAKGVPGTSSKGQEVRCTQTAGSWTVTATKRQSVNGTNE